MYIRVLLKHKNNSFYNNYSRNSNILDIFLSFQHKLSSEFLVNILIYLLK